MGWKKKTNNDLSEGEEKSKILKTSKICEGKVSSGEKNLTNSLKDLMVEMRRHLLNKKYLA